MNDPENVLRELRRGVYPAPDPEQERARRERIAGRVLTLGRELEQKRSRQRFGLGVLLAALVGGGLCALFFVLREPAPLALPAEGPEPLQLVAGHVSRRSPDGLEPLGADTLDTRSAPVLVTGAGEAAELRLPSQTALNVAPASEVAVLRRGGKAQFEERLRLRAGSVALKVPKLGTRGTLAVETRDAEVEVHGTEFSVRVVEQPPLDPFTEVDVREGRVLVRAGAQRRMLGAGEHWSSRPAPAATPAPAPEPAPAVEPELAPAQKERAAREAGRKRARGAVAASELAAQNRLLEAAELAQKNDMPGLALQRLEALITRYPDAELAHNARVERFRILKGMGRKSEALSAARAYLARHPDGFARAEAERLIDELSSEVP